MVQELRQLLRDAAVKVDAMDPDQMEKAMRQCAEELPLALTSLKYGVLPSGVRRPLWEDLSKAQQSVGDVSEEVERGHALAGVLRRHWPQLLLDEGEGGHAGAAAWRRMVEAAEAQPGPTAPQQVRTGLRALGAHTCTECAILGAWTGLRTLGTERCIVHPHLRYAYDFFCSCARPPQRHRRFASPLLVTAGTVAGRARPPAGAARGDPLVRHAGAQLAHRGPGPMLHGGVGRPVSQPSGGPWSTHTQRTVPHDTLHPARLRWDGPRASHVSLPYVVRYAVPCTAALWRVGGGGRCMHEHDEPHSIIDAQPFCPVSVPEQKRQHEL